MPIVCGNNAKESDPNHISMARIPEILKEKHDIEMEFQIHPMSTIGTDVSQLEAVQTGFIDMTSNATAQFSVFSTEFEFVGLPYAQPRPTGGAPPASRCGKRQEGRSTAASSSGWWRCADLAPDVPTT